MLMADHGVAQLAPLQQDAPSHHQHQPLVAQASPPASNEPPMPVPTVGVAPPSLDAQSHPHLTPPPPHIPLPGPVIIEQAPLVADAATASLHGFATLMPVPLVHKLEDMNVNAGQQSDSDLTGGKKRKRSGPSVPRHFNAVWLEDPEFRYWLRYDEVKGKMFCRICELHANTERNQFSTGGSANFRMSALKDHQNSKCHKEAAGAWHAERGIKVTDGRTYINQGWEEAVQLLKVAEWMNKEGVPITKFKSLCELLISFKCPGIPNDPMSVDAFMGTYLQTGSPVIAPSQFKLPGSDELPELSAAGEHSGTTAVSDHGMNGHGSTEEAMPPETMETGSMASNLHHSGQSLQTEIHYGLMSMHTDHHHAGEAFQADAHHGGGSLHHTERSLPTDHLSHAGAESLQPNMHHTPAALHHEEACLPRPTDMQHGVSCMHTSAHHGVGAFHHGDGSMQPDLQHTQDTVRTDLHHVEGSLQTDLQHTPQPPHHATESLEEDMHHGGGAMQADVHGDAAMRAGLHEHQGSMHHAEGLMETDPHHQGEGSMHVDMGHSEARLQTDVHHGDPSVPPEMHTDTGSMQAVLHAESFHPHSSVASMFPMPPTPTPGGAVEAVPSDVDMDTRIEPPSFHHESTVMHDSTTLHHPTGSNLHQHPSAGMHHVESCEMKIKTGDGAVEHMAVVMNGSSHHPPFLPTDDVPAIRDFAATAHAHVQHEF